MELIHMGKIAWWAIWNTQLDRWQLIERAPKYDLA